MIAPAKVERGGSRSKTTFLQLCGSFFVRHIQTCIGAAGRLYRTPVSSVLTIMVIGIAMALPSALYLTIKNFNVILGQWNPNPRISLYLQENTSEDAAISLTRELGGRTEFRSVEYISPETGIREVAETTGIHNILEILGENPLPRAIIITPSDTYAAPAEIRVLYSELQTLKQVQSARLDLAWVERLHGYMAVAERGFLILAILLALSVLLIVGNTIRLEIFNRKDEIIICKLIGATNAFIRRPFLYSGFWFGVVGGVIAWVILFICVILISEPFAELTQSYSSNFTLQGLTFLESLVMLLIALVLGLLGSLSAVSRHLRSIEPT